MYSHKRLPRIKGDGGRMSSTWSWTLTAELDYNKLSLELDLVFQSGSYEIVTFAMKEDMALGSYKHSSCPNNLFRELCPCHFNHRC